MIVLDTHIWVWWVHGEQRLKAPQAAVIAEHEADAIGISAISCWEIAKLSPRQDHCLIVQEARCTPQL